MNVLEVSRRTHAKLLVRNVTTKPNAFWLDSQRCEMTECRKKHRKEVFERRNVARKSFDECNTRESLIEKNQQIGEDKFENGISKHKCIIFRLRDSYFRYFLLRFISFRVKVEENRNDDVSHAIVFDHSARRSNGFPTFGQQLETVSQRLPCRVMCFPFRIYNRFLYFSSN